MSTTTQRRIIPPPATRRPTQQVTAFGRTYSEGYQPVTENRRCDLTLIDASHIAHFRCYSLKRGGKEICHHAHIDLTDGAVRCSCEWFTYKLARFNPTLSSPAELRCKHLARAIEVLKRRNILQMDALPEPACIKCGAVGASITAYDETGNVVIGAICHHCVESDLPIEEPEFMQEPSSRSHAATMSDTEFEATYGDIWD